MVSNVSPHPPPETETAYHIRLAMIGYVFLTFCSGSETAITGFIYGFSQKLPFW